MAMNNPYQQYRETQVSTASGVDLILMLYSGAIRFSKQAAIELEKGKFDSANTNLNKTQAIISELMGSLKMDVGEIAQNLYEIYDYINRRLVEANLKKDSQPIKEVLNYLTSLESAWVEINKIYKRVPQGGGSDIIA